MDTMQAFMKGECARANGDNMTYFDGKKIAKLMKENDVTTAEIYLGSDRGYTETTVTLEKGKLSAPGIGVDGSIWATPMLDIDGEEFEVGSSSEKNMTINFT